MIFLACGNLTTLRTKPKCIIARASLYTFGQPFSQSSTKYLVSLVLNKYVDIAPYGTDRYDRTLGVVYVDKKNVNLEMVKAGLAEVYRGKLAPGFDNAPYHKAEDEARIAGKGMWSLGNKYISPKEWRKYH